MKASERTACFPVFKGTSQSRVHSRCIKRLHSDSMLDARTNVLRYNEECTGRKQEKNIDERREDAREDKKSMVTTRNQYFMMRRSRAVVTNSCVTILVSMQSLYSVRFDG